MDILICLNELRKILIKKNFGNFDFIYKSDIVETILDKNSENDWKIEEIIVKKIIQNLFILKLKMKKNLIIIIMKYLLHFIIIIINYLKKN